MRELVQEPMNTRSTRISVSGVLGFRPMYSSARSMPLRRTSSFSRSGSGTRESTGSTISGEVPQVTCGLMSRASTSTTVSNFAPSSVCRVRQYLTAWSHSTPLGAKGRPRKYSTVLSSTATSPDRAPASMAMLQTVMRPSTDSARMALPANSMAWPVPPAVPMMPMMCSTTSWPYSRRATRPRP